MYSGYVGYHQREEGDQPPPADPLFITFNAYIPEGL